MARYLALDWDHNQLHVVLANVSGGTVRVLRAAVWPEEAPLTAGRRPAASASASRRAWPRRRSPPPRCSPASAAIASSSRTSAIPAVPAHEEPAVVRFQAVKELTGAADEVVLDYTPVGDGPSGDRRALVLVAKREQVDAYQELCQAAGLKLAGITPRPFGLATCIERLAGTTVLTPPPEPADGARWPCWPWPTAGPSSASAAAARCCWRARWCRGRTWPPRCAAAWPSTPGRPTRPAGPRRLRRRRRRQRRPPRAPAQPHRAARSTCSTRSPAPSEPDQPAPDKRGGFVGLVGLLYLRGSRAGLPVNFVHPKQPRPPQDPNRRKLVLVAGGGRRRAGGRRHARLPRNRQARPAGQGPEPAEHGPRRRSSPPSRRTTSASRPSAPGPIRTSSGSTSCTT